MDPAIRHLCKVLAFVDVYGSVYISFRMGPAAALALDSHCLDPLIAGRLFST